MHVSYQTKKVDERLPGKGNSNSHGARLVHLIITMIKWIRTSRLSRKNSLSRTRGGRPRHLGRHVWEAGQLVVVPPRLEFGGFRVGFCIDGSLRQAREFGGHV